MKNGVTGEENVQRKTEKHQPWMYLHTEINVDINMDHCVKTHFQGVNKKKSLKKSLFICIYSKYLLLDSEKQMPAWPASLEDSRPLKSTSKYPIHLFHSNIFDSDAPHNRGFSFSRDRAELAYLVAWWSHKVSSSGGKWEPVDTFLNRRQKSHRRPEAVIILGDLKRSAAYEECCGIHLLSIKLNQMQHVALACRSVVARGSVTLFTL